MAVSKWHKQDAPKRVTKNNLVQARVTKNEFGSIVEKAIVYTGGNVSDFVREAVLNYRPLKKVPK